MKKNKEPAWFRKHLKLIMTNLPYDGQLEDMENARKRKKRKGDSHLSEAQACWRLRSSRFLGRGARHS